MKELKSVIAISLVLAFIIMPLAHKKICGKGQHKSNISNEAACFPWRWPKPKLIVSVPPDDSGNPYVKP